MMNNVQMNLLGEAKAKKDNLIQERIEAYGVDSLFNFEALAVITGINEDILRPFKSLAELENKHEMLQCTKLQKTKLKAFFIMAKRYIKEEKGEIRKITSPSDVFYLCGSDLRYATKEYFKIVLLDTKNNVIDVVQVSEGSLNASIVHPREVFKEAILNSANGIILLHNHPSGICGDEKQGTSPSNEDINITNRLIDVGNMVGIKVLDHIIISGNEYLSFKEKNLF